MENLLNESTKQVTNIFDLDFKHLTKMGMIDAGLAMRIEDYLANEKEQFQVNHLEELEQPEKIAGYKVQDFFQRIVEAPEANQDREKQLQKENDELRTLVIALQIRVDQLKNREDELLAKFGGEKNAEEILAEARQTAREEILKAQSEAEMIRLNAPLEARAALISLRENQQAANRAVNQDLAEMMTTFTAMQKKISQLQKNQAKVNENFAEIIEDSLRNFEV